MYSSLAALISQRLNWYSVNRIRKLVLCESDTQMQFYKSKATVLLYSPFDNLNNHNENFKKIFESIRPYYEETIPILFCTKMLCFQGGLHPSSISTTN